MAFFTHGDQRDANDIIVVADAGGLSTVLTSLSRQDQLFAQGFKFEAACATAAMVDGLALHYLMIAKGPRKITFDAKTIARLKARRITLGQINHGLAVAKAFHDPALEVALAAFVTHRNHLTHHAAASIGTFDLQGFFDEGRKIALRLWQYTCAEVKKLNLPP